MRVFHLVFHVVAGPKHWSLDQRPDCSLGSHSLDDARAVAWRPPSGVACCSVGPRALIEQGAFAICAGGRVPPWSGSVMSCFAHWILAVMGRLLAATIT